MPPSFSNVAGFSEVTALAEREPGRFEGSAHPEWTVAGKPNGGYLLAMLTLAAARTSARPHVLAASAHYLRSPEPGPVTAAADVVRSGRSISQVRAWLSQNGKTCVEALLTLGQLDAAEKPYWQDGLPRPEGAAYEDCERFDPATSAGFRVAIANQVEIRLDPGSRGFLTATPSGRGELRGWLSLPHGELFEPASLLYAVDSFPPATLDIGTSGWVPTLELTVYIRALPAPGPVRVLQRAQLVQGQFVDEACYVWDSEDRLVAQATQLAGIRFR